MVEYKLDIFVQLALHHFNSQAKDKLMKKAIQIALIVALVVPVAMLLDGNVNNDGVAYATLAALVCGNAVAARG